MDDKYSRLVNKDHLLDMNDIPDKSELINFKSDYLKDDMYLEVITFGAYMDLKKQMASYGYYVDTDSTFRTYQEQVDVMNEFIQLEGEEKARKRVSMPLASEHHLGYAIDLVFIRDNIYIDEIKDDDLDYQCVLEHLSEHGFILRYPKGSTEKTGIMYEPWHIRYVGIDLAKYLETNNLLLEDYYENMLENETIKSRK